MNKSRPIMFAFRASEVEAEEIRKKIAESGKSQQEYLLDQAMGEVEITQTDMNILVKRIKGYENLLKAAGMMQDDSEK